MARIEIPSPASKRVLVTIEGISGLIPHRFIDQPGYSEPEDAEEQFRDSLYIISPNKYGFPASAIKKALVQAGPPEVSTAIYIEGELIEIEGSEPTPKSMRVKRDGQHQRVTRACFENWKMRVPMTYDSKRITERGLMNLIGVAGWDIGIGQNRPENGRFRPVGISRQDELEKSA